MDDPIGWDCEDKLVLIIWEPDKDDRILCGKD